MVLAPWVQIVVGLALVSTMMALLWLVQLRTRNAGIVDVGWAAGIGILGVLFAASAGGDPARRWLVGAMIGLWSLRLAVYLLRDRVIGHPEEGRYKTLRANWGSQADRNLFVFFQAQAGLSLLFALPALVAAHHAAGGLRVWDWIGLAVWLVAVTNTALADWQLARFKARPDSRGKTCREGWWRYSRHPNYFFEWLHWWSYALLAVGSAWWPVPVAAPLIMLFFMLKVTGIPPTEAQALASRGEEYRSYQRTTSPFIPWPPRKEAQP